MRSLALLVTLGTAARADPAITLRWDRDPEPAPALELDPSLRSAIEGIGAQEVVVDRSFYRFGTKTRAATETSVWSNDRDAAANGWTIAGRLSRELGGGVTLSLDASLARVIGGLDRDNTSYGSIGLTLARLFHWSHGVAWISLGIGYETWLGPAPSQLPSGAVARLSVGTTF